MKARAATVLVDIVTGAFLGLLILAIGLWGLVAQDAPLLLEAITAAVALIGTVVLGLWLENNSY